MLKCWGYIPLQQLKIWRGEVKPPSPVPWMFLHDWTSVRFNWRGNPPIKLFSWGGTYKLWGQGPSDGSSPAKTNGPQGAETTRSTGEKKLFRQNTFMTVSLSLHLYHKRPFRNFLKVFLWIRFIFKKPKMSMIVTLTFIM